MLDRTKHENTMRNILDDIYSHKTLAPILGFKGGTACYFFYKLPRFSTDLDFNLLNLKKKQLVYDLLLPLLEKHGKVADKYIKKNTIFFYIVHTKQRTGIKIEISIRDIEKVNSYELKEFYGTSMLVMKKSDLFANKLIALKNRGAATSRDLFDINFFFHQNWDISKEIVTKVTGVELITYLKESVKFIEKNFNYKTIHLGLGELVSDPKQRSFIKNKLIDDVINQLNFYIDSETRQINSLTKKMI